MGDKENNVGEDPNLSIEMRDGDKNNNDDFTSRSHNNGGGSMDELEVAALQDHFTLFAVSPCLDIAAWVGRRSPTGKEP